MNRIRKWLLYLRDNLGFTLLLAVLFGLASSNSKLLFDLFGLPEFASATDDLSQSQIMLGLGIGLVNTLISIIALYFKICVLVSFMFFFYRLLSSKKTGKRKK